MSTKEAQAEAEELPPLLDVEQAEGISEEAELAEETKPDIEPQPNEAANDSDSPMETVRDLLFGDMARALRRELHLTVRNLRGTVKVVHRELKQRMDDLGDQISAVQMALDNESTEREELTGQLTKQIEQGGEALQVKLQEQNESMQVALKQVGTDLEMQTNNHQHALDELEKKVFSALEEYSAEFRDSKMNRNEFAEMLANLAGRVGTDED